MQAGHSNKHYATGFRSCKIFSLINPFKKINPFKRYHRPILQQKKYEKIYFHDFYIHLYTD